MSTAPVVARRLVDAPIIRPEIDARIGTNINGPSMIRAPGWAARPLGRYYLYFADHRGRFIRLAHADQLVGPWRIHAAGCLELSESRFCVERPAPDRPTPEWAEGQDSLYPHIASPDVHVEPERRRIRLYFHGLLPDGEQATRVALSEDGLSFTVLPELLGPSYFRAFRHGDGDAAWWYALAHPNRLLRSRDGLGCFEPGPELLAPTMRHTAALVRGDTLHLFWTRIGDAPERIFHGSVDLRADWRDWRVSAPREILRPERDWEGADLPVEPSRAGAVDAPANQLRDPAVFVEGAAVRLLYSVAGEHGIGLAALSGL